MVSRDLCSSCVVTIALQQNLMNDCHDNKVTGKTNIKIGNINAKRLFLPATLLAKSKL